MRIGQLLSLLLLLSSIINSSFDGGGEAKARHHYSLASSVTDNSSVGTDTKLEAKKKKKHKQKRQKKKKGNPTGISENPRKWPKGCCWQNEGTVSFRNFGDDRFADAYIQIVEDLNYMTAHMPHAPKFIFVDESHISCDQMNRSVPKYGVMICTVEPGEPLWSKFDPPGCPDCASSWLDGKVTNQPDGWWGHIYLENTDATDISPQRAQSCGPPSYTCKGVYEIRIGLVAHETAHALLAIPHTVGSTTIAHPGTRPFGPVDFQRAELWWGQSTVPYCVLYPNGYGCTKQAHIALLGIFPKWRFFI